MQITKEHLEFLEEAKDGFESSPHYKTYMDEEKQLIALRRGEDEDCIQIFELGTEVGFFAQMIPPIKKVISIPVLDFGIEIDKCINDFTGWLNPPSPYDFPTLLAEYYGYLQYELNKPKEFWDRDRIDDICVKIATFALKVSEYQGKRL